MLPTFTPLVSKLFPKPIFTAFTALLVSAVTYVLWKQVLFSYWEPRLWMVLFGVGACSLLFARIPILLWLWWLAGAVTIFWSLAPGNTLIAGLWSILFLAAFGAGFWRPGFWIASLILLFYGLEKSLLLNFYGFTTYISSSTGYTSGAQALALIPVSFAFLLRSKTTWQRLLFALLLLASTYMAMISGARAVYLPLILIVILLVVRLILEGKRWWIVLGTLTLLTVALLGLDYAIPSHPMQSALGTKASVSAQTQATSDQGVFSNRLRLWNQAFDIVLAHPLGAGDGSYQAVILTYQKYPMAWANSPHNYYVETVATGGWLRLAFLLALLVLPLWQAWFSTQWPWTLAAAGVWATLAFDVTALFPSFMMYAFFVLGTTHFASQGKTPKTVEKRGVARPQVFVGALSLIAMAGLALWWYLPCSGVSCATARYLGVDFKMAPALESASDSERTALLKRARELYPESAWVLRAEKVYAPTQSQKLSVAREIATRFPYQDPQNYLDWANLAHSLNMSQEEATALTQGLRIFPQGKYPYGEQRITPERYQQWFDEAETRLTQLNPPP